MTVDHLAGARRNLDHIDRAAEDARRLAEDLEGWVEDIDSLAASAGRLRARTEGQ